MKILLIENDLSLALSIQKYLNNENYLCEMTTSLYDGIALIYNFDYNCILLDNSAFKNKGLAFVKDLKNNKKHLAIIVFSIDNSVQTKINILKFGADDYLVKPIHFNELSARIEAVMRGFFFRTDNEFMFKNLKVDITGRTAFIDKININLTKTEFDILVILLINKGKVISKSRIAEQVFGQLFMENYNFDLLYTHIKNLKKKLDLLGNYIQTKYALGYKFS